jgi:hypothetical protein
MDKKEFKTFEELGLIFTGESDCITCRDLSCHNNVPSTFNRREYNVHISMNSEKSDFYVHASESSNTDNSHDITASFAKEHDAVAFVCKNFDWFKCF